MEGGRFVVVCASCGTGYSPQGWAWLDALGVQEFDGDIAALDLRRCGVPRCCNTLARPVEGPRWIAANDGR